jgi:hypothetical protein
MAYEVQEVESQNRSAGMTVLSFHFAKPPTLSGCLRFRRLDSQIAWPVNVLSVLDVSRVGCSLPFVTSERLVHVEATFWLSCPVCCVIGTL